MRTRNRAPGRDVQPREDEHLAAELEPRDLARVVVGCDPRVDHGAGFEAAEQRPQVEAMGERLRRALGDHAPAVHQHDRVREPHDLLDRMAHVDDQDPQLVAQPLDVREDLALALGVERRERLVHEQEARLREEGAADRDALLLAAGETPRSPVEQVADAEEIDDRVERDRPVPRRRALPAVPEVVPHAQVREEARVLEDVADAPALHRHVDPARRIVEHVAVRHDPTFVGPEQAGDRGDDRGLAGAGAPEERREPVRVGAERRVEAEAAELLADGDL